MKGSHCFQVCFRTSDGGCTAPQGHFRDEAEALRWAGKRQAWAVWTYVFPGERIKWTVRERAAKKPRAA